MNQTTKRTQAELQKLINDWRHDPCWDLWVSDGFEAHASELEAYDKAYSMYSYETKIEIHTVEHDLTFGTFEADEEVAERLNAGWEIAYQVTNTVGTAQMDGLWRANHYRIIMFKRTVKIPTDREELLEDARVALMASASDAPEVDEADRLAREEHALEMFYEDAMSESEKSE